MARCLSHGSRFRHVRRVVLVGTVLNPDDADKANLYRLTTDGDNDSSSDSDDEDDDNRLFSPDSRPLTAQQKLG